MQVLNTTRQFELCELRRVGWNLTNHKGVHRGGVACGDELLAG